jgi:hypothetical protein
MPRIRPPRRRAQQEEVEQILQDAEPPPVGDIEIQLDDEPIGDLEVSIAAPPRAEEPEPRPAPQPRAVPEDDAVARALEAQRRAEELHRDAVRQRDEAIRQAQERGAELSRERTDREDAEYNSVLTAIAAENSALEKAQADYAAAASVGDWATAAQAQRSMATAAGRLDRLEDGKRSFDSRREATSKTRTEPQPPPRQTPTFEQQIQGLPQNAQAWLRNHPEFMTDAAKNQEIQSAHSYLVNRRKVTAFSDAYFEAMNQEFGFNEQQPATRQPAAPQPQRRSMPMSAPVSREVPTASGTRQKNSMHLTEEERQTARLSIPDRPDLPKLTNAQKEYMYAKNKAKYETMKANGTYSEQRQR